MITLNVYQLHNIEKYKIVIAGSLMKRYGIVSAAQVVTNLQRYFITSRYARLMVETDGEVPNKVNTQLRDTTRDEETLQPPIASC